LDKTLVLLEKVETEGLFLALEKGIFANVKRSKIGGKGLDVVSKRSAYYMNPFISIMKNH
jgi:beta-lysine 5,6-aminomutase alpha subunit